MKITKITVLATAIGLMVTGVSFADVPDPYQNSGSNNVSYDLPSKFYIGANMGYSMFTRDDFTVLGKNGSLNANSIAFGGVAGYKFNDYSALELNLQHLGKLRYKGNSIPFSYRASIYDLSGDLLLSYPLARGYSCTTSIFGKAGYGFSFSNYNYHTHDNSVSRSGDLIKGGYNFGFGVNIDFRSNISARIGYTYHQVHYPAPGASGKSGAHLFTFGLAYNFD